MIPAITIKSNTKQVRTNLGRFITQIPKVSDKMAYRIANIFREEMYNQLQKAGWQGNPLHWTGNLMEYLSNESNCIIRTSREKNASGWGIKMPLYAMYQEYAQPHWVAPAKHPILEQWAQETLGTVPPLLFVRNHPFIRPAIQPAARRMRDYLSKNRDLNNLLKTMR
jgi:hypothetical protein